VKGWPEAGASGRLNAARQLLVRRPTDRSSARRPCAGPQHAFL